MQVFIDIAIGDVDQHHDQVQRHAKAHAWVKQWASTYGLESDDLDCLGDQDKETVRDILASDPTAQQEQWLVDAITPLAGGRLVFDLWMDKCPKTCENFLQLCQGGKISKSAKKPLHYQSTHLFRLVPNFIVQGGDVTRDDGSGGDSIYNGKFNDEKPGLIKFGAAGQLAMANR
ncbi:cyclophilin-like protein [Hesseltinella vesiculosa]|uniref:Peptidyl-prolyl cis-trans isomerase n=1 Tax=Hesseltinella vesiculosa TaxID=101127 RepID=A0A1X2G691_9FUNG|nr:cyclophilin-like protein [Hesseltinella vesiculosa]